MLERASQKFRAGCMMVAHEEAGAMTFRGSSFLIHEAGYLLTAAHIVHRQERLLIIPGDTGTDYLPMSVDRVTALSAAVVRRDLDHDVALLKLDAGSAIAVPDEFLGSSEYLTPGIPVLTLGYSFGHQQLHHVLALDAILSAKIRSRNDTRLLLFSTMVHDGDRGGPLINAADGRIIGVVSGRLEPTEVVRGGVEWDRAPPRDTNVSYAVPIEYGLELMHAEGIV